VNAPIVVGVDGSEESRRAATLGYSIARAGAAPLHLLAAAMNTVLEVVAVEAHLDLDRLDEAVRQSAETGTRNSLEGSLPPDLIDSSLVCRIGRAEHVLSEFADEVDAGLIVLGGRRHIAPLGWFPRGTAQHLVRKSDTPVLVTAPLSEDPEIRRVLLALDFSAAAPRVIEFGRTLAETLGAQLEAVHGVDARLLSVESPVQLTLDSLREAHERRARDLWALLPGDTAKRVVIGPIPETLAEAAASVPGTLVVVGSHGLGAVNRWLLGSSTEWMLDRLPAAVAVVPAYEKSLS
jgi:nucleotide-binding universal stress UspA family protein